MATGTSGARCSSAAAMVAAAGLCVAREQGRRGAFIAGHMWRQCAMDRSTPRHNMGRDTARVRWGVGGRRASGVRRRRRLVHEGTTRGSQGEGRKGQFGAKGSHRERTYWYWPVSACEPGETAAARSRHGAGTRDAGATARTGTFPISVTLF
jgi:hypothetical protein